MRFYIFNEAAKRIHHGLIVVMAQCSKPPLGEGPTNGSIPRRVSRIAPVADILGRKQRRWGMPRPRFENN